MKLPTPLFLHELADAADRETMPRFRKPVETSSKPKEGYRFDPVTEADREAERAMRELIKDRYPEHAVLGEEYGAQGRGPVQWVLDPIDGTRPFLLGLPVWGTLIGLSFNGRATIGMMSQPVTGERFWADDSGSWLEANGNRVALKASEQIELSHAVLHTNSPESIRNNPDVPFSALDDKVKMTRYGGECYAFAMLAAGRIDLCVEFNLQPYDIVAMIPIIERAGGIVTTFEGRPADAGGRVLASANLNLHEAALEILNQRP